MNTRNRIVLGLSSTALVVGAGAGIATAAQKDAGGPAGGGPPGATAIATYLGLTADQVRSELLTGETLAQIAAAQGKSVSGLEAAIVADAKAHLDAGVAAGDLTAAQEATMLSNLQSHIGDMVNSTGPPAGGSSVPGRGPGDPATKAIADYLELTAAQIGSDLKGGETLAQIAAAQGKSVSGLEAAIVADAKTHLDAAVAAGNLTSAQEASMLSDLQSRVADMVNSTGPPEGGPGSPGAATTNGPRK
jgi:hypothetical protein